MRSLQRYLFAMMIVGGVLLGGCSCWNGDGNGYYNGYNGNGAMLESSGDILSTLRASDNFDTLTRALDAAGLSQKLQQEGPFTLFAPTDEAFNELPQEQLNSLLEPANSEKLREILSYHVLPGNYDSETLAEMDRAYTLSGQPLNFGITVDYDVAQKKYGTPFYGNRLMVERVRTTDIETNGATVIDKDISTTNGIIHVIDKVMMP